MKKKFLLALVVITLSILAFGVITASAATSGIYTYTVSGGNATITGCDKSASGEIVIPSTLGGYPVTGIKSRAFSQCDNITSVTIPEGVTSIGNDAFSYCDSLTSITIPGSVTGIGESAFIGCESLTSITISKGVTSIGNDAFRYCDSLTSITIPEGVTSIGNDAFSYCDSLTSITIPDSVTSIGESAFSFCDSLTRVNITDIAKWCQITFADISANPMWYGSSLYLNNNLVKKLKIPEGVTSIGNYAFYGCDSLTSVTIPEGVTSIANYAFGLCDMTSITIPKGVTSIGESAFEWCYRLTSVYYNGTEDDWNNIIIGNNNDHLTSATKYFFYYITLINEENEIILDSRLSPDSIINFSIYEKTGYTLEVYTDDKFTNKFDVQTPITENTTLYIRYVINEHTYKFVDEDGTTLKEVTADYGTIIQTPASPSDKDPYTFDHWEGYTEGMTLSDDVTFTAVYRYKDYSITAEGLSEPVTVTYNSSFTIAPQTMDDYHYFIGYFTEKDGEGVQVTNENGESLKPYDIVGGLTVYPYFYEGYMNKIKLQGTPSAMPGDTITVSPIFATDKDAMFLTLTIKYSRVLNYKSINNIDFEEVSIDSEKTVGDYKYIDITCINDYEGNYIDKNMDFTPFDMEFEVLSNAPLGNSEITIENVVLVGDDNYDITDITNYTCEIVGKLAESIEIIGENTIDKATQFSAVVSPDYTTDKSVVWSGNNEEIATVTQDGLVTPVKNGSVTLTATAKDGSGVFTTKTIYVIAYAKIDNIDFGAGVCLEGFNPDVIKYTVYVGNDATSISLTPTFSGGGVLRPNGSGVWLSGRSKDFELSGETTTITLNRENVTDMTNSVYTVEIVKFEGTKTIVSDNGKEFTINPLGIETGKTIILALYNGNSLVDIQKTIYVGNVIPFTSTKEYTNAKVMVWNSLSGLVPVCESEIVK